MSFLIIFRRSSFWITKNLLLRSWQRIGAKEIFQELRILDHGSEQGWQLEERKEGCSKWNHHQHWINTASSSSSPHHHIIIIITSSIHQHHHNYHRLNFHHYYPPSPEAGRSTYHSIHSAQVSPRMLKTKPIGSLHRCNQVFQIICRKWTFVILDFTITDCWSNFTFCDCILHFASADWILKLVIVFCILYFAFCTLQLLIEFCNCWLHFAFCSCWLHFKAALHMIAFPSLPINAAVANIFHYISLFKTQPCFAVQGVVYNE